MQLILSGLQRKCIWVLIPVPPQLQTEKRSLVCLTFAIKAPKVLQESRGLILVSSFKICSTSPCKLHAAIIQFQDSCFAPYKTRKGNLVSLLWIVLKLPTNRHFGYFKSHSIQLKMLLQGPLQPRHLPPSMQQLTILLGRRDFQHEHYLMLRSPKFSLVFFLTNTLYVSVQQNSG